ncbi:hypothetical protein GQ53DRAFT_811000 [Thozetella sp. PMI_491]|nr:hypothetical protein GQ53DRAFT_811000 [Thozetella sp. PMI_491]
MSDKNTAYYQCQNCHYAFSDARQLEHHLRVYDDALVDACINAAKVLRHFPITHEILCPYINQKCRNSRFTRFQDFASHYNTHLECKKECPGCRTKFTRSSQLMAHGCKEAQEDPTCKKKLSELKDWAIEKNLYEAKQAQLKFREELEEQGKGFLNSSLALRLMIRGLIPKAKREITTKIRDNLELHMDAIIDGVIEKIQKNLNGNSANPPHPSPLSIDRERRLTCSGGKGLSMQDRQGAEMVQKMNLDHHYGTSVPYIDPSQADAPLIDSGYYLIHDRVFKPEGPDESRRLLPRCTELSPKYIAYPPAGGASPPSSFHVAATDRRAGRRVVRGKPRPGAKAPRPKINGPPRVRDKGRSRVTKPGQRRKPQDCHQDLDSYMAREFYKKEPLSPSDSEGTESDDEVDLPSHDKPYADPRGFASEIGRNDMPTSFMNTDINVFHASVSDQPSTVGGGPPTWGTHGQTGELSTSDESAEPHQHPERTNSTSLPTPRSASPIDGASGMRHRVPNSGYGGPVPAGPHIVTGNAVQLSGGAQPPSSAQSPVGIPPPARAQVPDRVSAQEDAAPVSIPLVDGLPYHIRRGSAPTLRVTSDSDGNQHNHHPHAHPIDRTATIPQSSGGTFMGGMNPVSVNGFMVGWNQVTYQDWPASNVILVDPLAQTIPPGVQPHPPMVLGNSAPEAFLGGATMAEAMHPASSHRLSFDSQASFLGSSSNHSSYDGGSRSTFSSAGSGRSTNPESWKYAPSDEKTGYTFNFD